MAFTSRAPRVIGQQNRSTQNRVGPGSYNVVRSHSAKLIRHNDPSCFGHSTNRGLLYYEIDDYQPGVGQYHTPDFVEKSFITHSSFKSNVQRFVENNHPKTPIPGPADYNVIYDSIEDKANKMKQNKLIQKAIKNFNDKQSNSDSNGNAQRPLSATNKVSLSRNPPSIPFGETAHGYDTTIDGQLVPRKPPNLPERDIDIEQIHPKQDGVGWSKSKTMRFVDPTMSMDVEKDTVKLTHAMQNWIRPKQINQNPSNHEDIVHRRNSNNNTNQNQHKQQININRFRRKNLRKKPQRVLSLPELQRLQKFYAEKIMEETPKSESFKSKSIDNETKARNSNAVFKSKSKRFEQFSSETPGVGSYDITTNLGTKKERESVKSQTQQKLRSPMTNPKLLKNPSKPSTAGQHHQYDIFRKDAIEEQKADEKDPRPGPGYYEIPSAFKSIDDVMAKSIQLGLPPKAPFLSTVGKFTSTITETSKETPGPGYYIGEVREMGYLKRPRIKYHKAPFGQHGDIIRNEIDRDNIKVGPGKYDTATASYLTAPNAAKQGAVSVFKSKSDRIVYDKADNKTNPGVGSYNIATSIIAEEVPHNVYRFETMNQRPFITGERRFMKSKYAIKTPGAGQYNVDALNSVSTENIEAEVKKTKRIKTKKPPPFGSSSNRLEKRNMEMSPGPNSYYVVKENSFITKTFNCTYS